MMRSLCMSCLLCSCTQQMINFGCAGYISTSWMEYCGHSGLTNMASMSGSLLGTRGEPWRGVTLKMVSLAEGKSMYTCEENLL